MRAGKIYRRFRTSNGREVLLRVLKWEDLDDIVKFVHGLVDDRVGDAGFGIHLDRKFSRREEAEWLAKQLVAIEKGTVISVVAEVDGKFVGNSEVTRGEVRDLQGHGRLGIAISREYRGAGIGGAMLRTLLDQCVRRGLHTVELEVLMTNPRAMRLYERLGFRKVGVLKKKVNRGGRFIDVVVMSTELSRERTTAKH